MSALDVSGGAQQHRWGPIAILAPMPGSEREYFVYILASERKTLYTGMTNDLARRVAEHKRGDVLSFTSRYAVNKLVYYEVAADVRDAIAREKQIKAWTRAERVALIAAQNPEWDDLAGDVLGGV
jgi:putative endonuclease